VFVLTLYWRVAKVREGVRPIGSRYSLTAKLRAAKSAGQERLTVATVT
jgi:hypothetical protein